MEETNTRQQLADLGELLAEAEQRANEHYNVMIRVARLRMEIILGVDLNEADQDLKDQAAEWFLRIARAQNTTPVLAGKADSIPFITTPTTDESQRAWFFMNLAILIDGRNGLTVRQTGTGFLVQRLAGDREDYYQISSARIDSLIQSYGIEEWKRTSPPIEP